LLIPVLETVRHTLEQSPMLALFATIAIGYAIGRVSVAGFSLDIGAVLFAGLAIGAIAPGSAPPALVSSIGLVMFLYGIGIQYGRQFFAGFRGNGLKWNAIGALSVLTSLAAAILAGHAFGVLPAHSLGMFAGALTSTPTLQAAIDAFGNRSPAIGYSVAYPFGIIVPILCMFALTKVVRMRLASATPPPATVEVVLGQNATVATVGELLAALPAGVRIVAVRQGKTNRLPDPELRLTGGDMVMLFGPSDVVHDTSRRLGRVGTGQLAADRSALDLARYFVSRAPLTGVPISALTFPGDVAAMVVEVRRADTVLVAEPDLVLEYGDRVAVIASRAHQQALRAYFGDSIKSTTEVSYLSVGLGMSLGVLLGLIQVPLPVIGRLSIGLAGGPLVMALILGRLVRTGPFTWHMPLPANLTLRTFGLTLFLAAVGLGSGAPFVETLAAKGFLFLAISTAVILTPMLVLFVSGHFLMRMHTDDLLGATTGVTGNPAILVYANRMVSSPEIDAAYAITFPTLTVFKIICVQVAAALLGAGSAF
jgi:putative transport protein